MIRKRFCLLVVLLCFTTQVYAHDDDELFKLVSKIRKKYDLKPYLDKVNTLDKDDLVEFQVRAKTRARVEGSMLMKCMTRY